MGAVFGLGLWLTMPVAAPPVRNPFAGGLREVAPSASGLGAYILAAFWRERPCNPIQIRALL